MSTLRHPAFAPRALFLAFLVFMTAGAMAGAGDDPLPAARKIRTHAQPLELPAFTLTAASGTSVTPASLAGTVTVLNVWATWCSPCLRELPSLDRLQQRFAGRVRVLAVAQDKEGAAAAAPYLQRLGVRHLDVLYDPDATLSSAFRARVLPLTVILDRRGREAARVMGDLDWADPSVVGFLQPLVDR